MGSRDANTHQQLLNWAAHINADWQDGPRRYPRSASWQDQISGSRQPIDPPEPLYIDHSAAERTQESMVSCMASDIECATILTKHYRDSIMTNNIRKFRNRFWKYI